MTRIDPQGALSTLLRSELAAVRERGRPAGAAVGEAPSAGGASALAAAVAQRVNALAAADPDRRRKAVRIFLETVFLQELGAGLLNDPTFPTMVDAVQARLAGDAQLAAASQALADVLLKEAGQCPALTTTCPSPPACPGA
jgi:hypothetical protein